MARLPKAIQAQLEKAEAIEQQMSDAAKPPPTALETGAAQAQQAEAPPQVPPSPEPPAAPQPPAPAPVPQQPQQPQVDWEHKFRTVQGMLSERDRRIDALERKLSEKAAEAPKPPEKPSADPKDIEDFGKDLVEMVMRNSEKLMAKYQSMLEELGGRVARLEQGVSAANETSAFTAEQVFLTKLGQAVPDWEQINVDQRFLGWLSEVDPIYGQPRQAALDAASQRFDAQRVANIFLTFKRQLTAVQPPSPSALETQVSPSASAGTPQPQPAPNKPVYTQKQLTDFYNDVARGRYRGREAEATQIEAEINNAIAEGRVR